MDSGHAELQRAVVHEPEDVTEPSSCQPLHVDLVLVPLPHVCCEHDPEVVALGGQKRLVGLQENGHTGVTVKLTEATMSFYILSKVKAWKKQNKNMIYSNRGSS